MSLPVEIADGKGGTQNKVRVTSRGQLITAPLDFSEPHFNEMAVDNQVYNFVEPVGGKQFVITGVLVNGARDVGNNGAIVRIYQATAIDSAVATKTIITMDIARSSALAMTNLNTIMSPGLWLNARTADNTVFLTILGYFVDTES